jgi:hypoxanthine phosphoribosyltransferase
MSTKNYYDYIDITMMCQEIARQARSYDIDLIVGITRGGLIPAVYLSHELEIPMEVVAWTTRDGDFKEHNMNVSDAIEAGKNVLFVDEINDSGTTLVGINKHYVAPGNTNVYFASLIEKKSSLFNCDFKCVSMDPAQDDVWHVFPWEKSNEMTLAGGTIQ